MALTWKRDSYGLYDYEMKEPYKQNFKFDTSMQMIRVETECIVDKLDVLLQKYKNKAQLLMTVEKVKNSYVIKPSPIVMWE